MSRIGILKSLALASSMVVSAAAHATTVYTQPYDGNAFLYASQNDTTGGFGNFATVYDNFTLGLSANLTGVSFTGGYFNPNSVASITSFVLQIYGDSLGQPGSSLYTTTVPGNGGESCDATPICTYTFNVAFAAAAGTQYWMSIVPTVGYPPQWGWATGAGGDSVAYQDFLGARGKLGADMAFSLDATPAVPEPATWTMMLIGFGAIGAAFRRRRPKLSFA